MQMEEDKESPSDINSLKVLNILRTIKKRKLQGEQLDLPEPKQTCWDRAIVSDCPVSVLHGSRETGKIERFVSEKKQKAQRSASYQSGPESVMDSNSFGEDSDSSTSLCAESKMEKEYAKALDHQMCFSSDCSENMKGVCVGEEGTQAFPSFDDQLLEFENHGDYIPSEYGEESLDQCTDKELEDLLFASGLNSNVYVLSSGRWTVNQEAQLSSRKPTIDQEFEQYFSSLML